MTGDGYTQQELGRMAANQSLANRGITHRFVSAVSWATPLRSSKDEACVSCLMPRDHPVHKP